MHLRDYHVPMFLPYGVTTIADIHNDTAWSLAQREALRNGTIKGPRLFVSGARVTGPLGPPTTDGSYARTADEARAYVRSLAKAGIDHIKVDLTITDDQLRAVIEEGAAAGLKALSPFNKLRVVPSHVEGRGSGAGHGGPALRPAQGVVSPSNDASDRAGVWGGAPR